MKNRKINFIKLGTLLFGVSLLLFNCNQEEIEITSNTENQKKKITFKTVSIEGAMTIFEKRNKITTLLSRGSNDDFEVDPQWETTQQDSLSFTEVLLTNTETIINRDGDYTSKVFFIQVNDSIVSAIKTTYINEEGENGGIKSGHIFFNNLEGKFLDAYKVSEGEVSHRLIISTQTQQASFFSLFLYLFQEDNNGNEEDFWCDNGMGGNLDEVEVVANPTINYEDPGAQDPSFTANNQAIHGFLSNGSYSDVAGGGGNSDPNDTNTSNNCQSDREWNNATQTCDCKGENKVENPITGNCIDNPCINNDQLIYNKQTGQCNCTERNKIKIGDNCVDDNPCNRIKQHLNNPNVLDKLHKLERKTSLKKENGYSQSKNGPLTELHNTSSGHQLNFTITDDMVGYLHTHVNKFFNGKYIDGNPEYEKPYKMFSDTDTFKFLELVKNAQTNNIPIKDVYAFMISSSGNYTLRFTGNTNDIDLALFDSPREKNEYRKKYKKIFNENRNVKQAYLHFLKDEIDITGIELYKVKNDGDDIERLTLKPNGKVQSDDCE